VISNIAIHSMPAEYQGSHMPRHLQTIQVG